MIERLTFEITETAGRTYSPQAVFGSVRPGVHITVNWPHGYHGPERDAQFRADAMAVVGQIAALPEILAALRKAEEILRKSGMACPDAGCAYCATASEIRDLLARIDAESGK